MTAALRPMTLGEILDRTFQIYRSKFMQLVGISALSAVAAMACYAIEVTWWRLHPHQSRSLIFYQSFSQLLWLVLMYVSSGFFRLLMRPAYVNVTRNTVDASQRATANPFAAFRENGKTFITLNLFEQSVVIVIPWFLVIGVALAAQASRSNGINDTPAEALFVLPIAGIAVLLSVWLAVSLCLSFPVAAVEHATWLNSVKRSWRLSRGNRGRATFTWCMVFFGSLLLEWVFDLILYVASNMLGGRWTLWYGVPTYYAYRALANAIMITLIGPVFPIAATLFYYDQRIRLEGYDIEWMMDAAGMNTPDPVPAHVTAAVPAQLEETER